MDAKELIEQINKFYSDKSRSREQTKDALEDVQCHIESLLETLEDDDGVE